MGGGVVPIHRKDFAHLGLSSLHIINVKSVGGIPLHRATFDAHELRPIAPRPAVLDALVGGGDHHGLGAGRNQANV